MILETEPLVWYGSRSNQSKLLKCILNRFLFIRRTNRNFAFTVTNIIVPTVLYPNFILNLGNIQTGNFNAKLFLNILFYLGICRSA